MTRADVEGDVQLTVGASLAPLDRVPDEFVAAEWELVKGLHFGETLIPNRYKELIGLSVAAVSRCPYGVVLHTEGARLHGASEAEIAEAVQYAKLVAGWSIHLTGLQVDQQEFVGQVRRIVAFLAGDAAAFVAEEGGTHE
jgi:AhpD family alkylhydroperoxidase